MDSSKENALCCKHEVVGLSQLPIERKKALTWVLCSQLIVQVNFKGNCLCFLIEAGIEIF